MSFRVWIAAINKSQGQTLDRIAVCLAGVEPDLEGNGLIVNVQPCFSHGQLYVALSRVGHPDRVRIYLDPVQHEELSTDNVVYTEVFLPPARSECAAQPSRADPFVPRHFESLEAEEGENAQPGTSFVCHAFPFDVVAENDAVSWAYYTHASFVPASERVMSSIDWFVCPLLADAAGLSMLYPPSLVCRPDLPDVWAAMPRWSTDDSPVRELTWDGLVQLAAMALERWHASLGDEGSVGSLPDALVERMDMQNHWPDDLCNAVLLLMDEATPHLTSAIRDAARALAEMAVGDEMPDDYCGPPIDYTNEALFEDPNLGASAGLNPEDGGLEPEDVYTPEQLLQLDLEASNDQDMLDFIAENACFDGGNFDDVAWADTELAAHDVAGCDMDVCQGSSLPLSDLPCDDGREWLERGLFHYLGS